MVLTRIFNKVPSDDQLFFEEVEPIKRCYFCNGNHLCRECPQEAILSPVLKKYIGSIMENFIGDNFCCPSCKEKKMKVLGNHTPSLDIICENCNRRFEVKSKCLSVEYLPKDLKLPHGSYDDYVKRQSNGLDFFIIIYKVDRIRKKITIREVLYATNSSILENDNIQVLKRKKSHLSNIIIKNKHLLHRMKMDKNYQFDFSKIIDKYMENYNSIKKDIFENSNNFVI